MSLVSRLWDRFERQFLIGPDDVSGDKLRVRAIAAFGSTALFIQSLNFAAIVRQKSLLSVEAAVCLFAAAAIVLALASLRQYRNFAVYAAGAGALCVGAPLATAVYDYTGVDSALMPMVVAAPMIVGFIGGPRHAAATGLAGLAVVTLLYFVSVAAPGTGPEAHARALQRAIHTSSGVFFVALTTTVVSANAFRTLRRLEETAARALRAEAARARFLATMSHELRTPMNGVLGLADALAAAPLAPADRESVETIRRSGQSLMRILDDILDLAKVDAGRIDLLIEPFAPRILARGLVAQWKDTAAARGVVLHAEVDPETPEHLGGDAQRIGQILANLVSNGVKFTPSGVVSVSISARPIGAGRYEFRAAVRDDGPGVPPEARERIFAPFEQADQGVSRAFGGTGLGLAISRRLAELMGGRLVLAESDGGANFVFTAPMSIAVAPERCAGEERASRPFDVLVVDDNAVNRMVAARLLDVLGHRATLVEDGLACLVALAARRFDAVLMDKNMPGLSGTETLRRLREDPALAPTPVIACTADASATERETLLETGFDGYLAKPLSAANLSAALAAACFRAPEPVGRLNAASEARA